MSIEKLAVSTDKAPFTSKRHFMLELGSQRRVTLTEPDKGSE